MFCDGDIKGYYELNHSLVMNGNMSITEIESMIPYEREIYSSLLIKKMRELKNG